MDNPHVNKYHCGWYISRGWRATYPYMDRQGFWHRYMKDTAHEGGDYFDSREEAEAVMNQFVHMDTPEGSVHSTPKETTP